MSDADTLAALVAYVNAHPPAPQPVPSSAQVAREMAAEHVAEEAKHDRAWASDRDMAWLAERRAG
jgi:hypothetical protein